MNAFEIIQRHYTPGTSLHETLVVHSVLVARKAIEIARDFISRHPTADVDLEFLKEASLLHDIGIKFCSAPEICCLGPEPYVKHGVLGKALLEAEGFPRHAIVCACHTGSGMTREEVHERGLPLPDADYLPLSLEEKIICVADKFYSKKPKKLWKEKKLDSIAEIISRHGSNALSRWEALRAEILGK